MGFPNKQETTYTNVLPKEGMRQARVARIIEIGDQETKYGIKSQLIYGFGLVNDFVEIDGEKKQQLVFSPKMSNKLSNNPAKPSKLDTYIDAIKPNSTTFEEQLSAPCMVNIKHVKVGEKTYANITAVTPPFEGMEYPELDMDVYYFDYENPDMEVWEKFSDYRKEQLKEALNFPGSKLEELVG